MAADFYLDSCGKGKIRCRRWEPAQTPKAVFQIIHGIAEHVERYDHFAEYLAEHGYLVVAEDHMGHGKSGGDGAIAGYFHGGWNAAVEDSYGLLTTLQQEYPHIPYILFGHSMGSFIARNILSRYPDSGIAASIISGTCWQPAFAMPAIVKLMDVICRFTDEEKPNEKLQNLVFGSYNARIEHPRTSLDWVSRDKQVVDAHPMNHGFRPAAGLLRDMMVGLNQVERQENLSAMDKKLPVFFVAGGDDPVGNYGKGIHAAADAFREAGMQNVSVRIYPLCRHEILNEINRQEIYEDILQWTENIIK